jgi:glycosyltransferase involved in cell wall biosynthesis
LKILFIRSGNNGLDPISSRQGNSLVKINHEVNYFDILGKGLMGYLSNAVLLRKKIREFNPDVIHAHYSFSGYLVFLTFTDKPIITSLMGSDVIRTKKLSKMLLLIFIKYIWNATIVKSPEMFDNLKCKKLNIIPNGVDTDEFFPVEKLFAQKTLGWNSNCKHLLFGSQKNRPEKNFQLAEQVFISLQKKYTNLQMHLLNNIPLKEIYLFYNAADVLLLTSNYEGSPNVIKEAMACNCPIVATDVGDIKKIIGNAENCFTTSFNPKEIFQKLDIILTSQKRSNGRSFLGNYESNDIAQKLIELYKSISK